MSDIEVSRERLAYEAVAQGELLRALLGAHVDILLRVKLGLVPESRMRTILLSRISRNTVSIAPQPHTLGFLSCEQFPMLGAPESGRNIIFLPNNAD